MSTRTDTTAPARARAGSRTASTNGKGKGNSQSTSTGSATGNGTSTGKGNGRATPVPPNAGDITSNRQAAFTVPGLDPAVGRRLVDLLQERLVALVDLSLTLKHIHWNVVGPNFIAVHEMLDPQYEAVLPMIDDVAERIATLGGSPSGLPGRLVASRTWDDYSLDRADSLSHLGALDVVYTGVIEAHRAAIDATEDDDPVSQDMLIQQAATLERAQWFVRSHLADWAGGVANAGATGELEAAQAVATKRHRPAQGNRAR